MSSPGITKVLPTPPCLGSTNEKGKICWLEKQGLELLWERHFSTAPQMSRRIHEEVGYRRSWGVNSSKEGGCRAGTGTPVFQESLAAGREGTQAVATGDWGVGEDRQTAVRHFSEVEHTGRTG